MPANECAALKCGRGLPRKLLMCRHHWSLVPVRLRNAITRLYNQSGVRTQAYWVARRLAVREVAIAEGNLPDDAARAKLIREWTDTRDRLKRELGDNYRPVVGLFARRLKKLMETIAATDPIEVCEFAMQVGKRRSSDYDDRRIAAAIELYQRAGAK